MNIVRHRIYKLELDIWEPLQGKAEKEIDEVVHLIKEKLQHCGHVRIALESEVRNESSVS